MATGAQMPSLPEYLSSFWRLRKDDTIQAKKRRDLKGWKASSLAEAYLKYQLGNFNRITEAQDQAKRVAPTLSSIATGKVLDVLNTSHNFEADLKTITNSLNSTTIRQLLADTRTPYLVLRALQDFLQSRSTDDGTIEQRGLLDTDDAVLATERYIRSRGEANRDNSYLVGLRELSKILRETPDSSEDHATITFVRRDPPKGGFEFLDAFRERVMQIHRHDDSFKKTFIRITKDVLKGLDWSNIFVAGGMVLTTLMHVDTSKDQERSVRDCDIDLYLYGLNPEQANRKVEEIYNVWCNNLPVDNRQKLVVKNAKTINLLPSYPNRRVQIILKLLPSPTQILLNFDLDACAIGFDGSRVLMLPRFARALETGYSVFTMDLIWGHHLGDRRATQEKRVFKYADRGFGLRILPSYAKSLEEDNLEKGLDKNEPQRENGIPADDSSSNENDTDSKMNYSLELALQTEQSRKPDGSEPGLKTLKRIAYLGQEFVNRFYFGASPLTINVNPSGGGGFVGDSDVDTESDGYAEHEQQYPRRLFLATSRDVYNANMALQEADEAQRLRLATEVGPFMSFTMLDTKDMHSELPDGRRGLGTFELFMRHCEAWRLNAHAYAT